MSKNKKKYHKQSKKKYFPNNLRFITDNFIWEFIRKKRRTLLIVFSTFLILIAISAVAYDTYNNYLDNERFAQERTKIENNIKFWQSAVERFPNYRDAYFELAILNYRLRKYENAKKYLDDALKLDPTFREGKELKEKLGD